MSNTAQSKGHSWVYNLFSCVCLFVYLWLAKFQKGFEAKDLPFFLFQVLELLVRPKVFIEYLITVLEIWGGGRQIKEKV